MSRWIRMPMLSALIFATVLTAAIVLTVAHRVPIWVTAVGAVVVFVLLFIPVRGRLVLVEWIAAVLAFMRRRHRPVTPVYPAATDIAVRSGEAGVRWDGETLVAVIEVAPELTFTRESGGRAQSGSTLPLTLVASLMSQYGLHLDIDIVSGGQHVPPGTAYRVVYSQAVGPRPILAQRRTWLVLRLNVIDNLAGVIERGPSRLGAPKALAAAAHRVVQRLGQEEIRSHVLSAEELDAMADLLRQPLTDDAREKWSTISCGAATSFVSSYIATNPAQLADEHLDRWWAWRAEDTVMTIRLTRAASGAIEVGVLMRYVHHGKPERPLPEARLAVATGAQRRALAAALPGGDTSLHMPLPTAPFNTVADVAIPIGPAGQILGQDSEGAFYAAPLWDQSAHPKRWRIEARVSTDQAAQLVLRAVVTGAVVALHTTNRPRWDGLVAAVGDPDRLFYATAGGARTCDLAVFDGRPVSTVPARTVLRLLAGDVNLTGSGADMTLVEGADQRMKVTIGSATPQVLQIIRSREEDRYLGLGEAPAAPRRVVSTAPVISRPPRPQPTRPEPARSAPRRPDSYRPSPAGYEQHPTGPGSEPVGPQRNPRTPVPQEPVPTGGRTGQRRLDIAGPQRVARSEPAPQPSSDGQQIPRSRRKFRLPNEPPPPSP